MGGDGDTRMGADADSSVHKGGDGGSRRINRHFILRKQ